MARQLTKHSPLPPEQRWRALTWPELEEWAGTHSLERGRTYQRGGRVHDLAVTGDGGLLAWVQGSRRYATHVRLGDSSRGGLLKAQCSCPLETGHCKHAVAVVLEYLEALKAKRPVPGTASSDERWHVLAQGLGGDWDEEEFDEDEWEGEAASRKRYARGGKVDSSIKRYLEGLPPGELMAYVLELAAQSRKVQRDLEQRAALAGGSADDLVRQARKELRSVTSERAEEGRWGRAGHSPDYSRLQHLFERLLEMGQADALLELGRELLERGSRQIAESDADDDAGQGIVDCLNVAFQAVPASSKSDVDKLLYLIEMYELDEYDLVQGAEEVVNRPWPAEAWSAVADVLARRLKRLPAGGDSFTTRYRRDHLSGWLIDALRGAGRDDEVLPLLEREAEATGNYQRLVDELIADKRPDEARRWILEGIEKTRQPWPGIASALRERWRELAQQQRDWATVAAMRADEFFRRPGLPSFTALLEAARKAKGEQPVRAAALCFLETGVRPEAGADWPLPELPAALLEPAWENQAEGPRPHLDVLLDIALEEKKPDEVLRWYDRMQKPKQARYFYGFEMGNEGRVADAVADTHPERAEALYRDLIDRYITQTSAAAYESALPYLRKLKALLQRNRRGAEWTKYLAGLREAHPRKRRLLDVLDRLERDRIVES
jgi:uncharacterized Zn finger protein